MKFIHILGFFLVFSRFGYLSVNADELVSAPPTALNARIVSEIDSAQTSLFVEAPTIVQRELQQALVNAIQRGVEVRIILDQQAHQGDNYTQADFFSDWGIKTFLYHAGQITTCFFVIDSSQVITGQFDLSRPTDGTDFLLILADNSSLTTQFLTSYENRLKDCHELLPKRLRVLLTPETAAAPQIKEEHTEKNEPTKPAAEEIELVGNSESLVLHKSTCASVKKMAEDKKVYMPTREDFIKAGYRPCGRCKP